MNMRVAAGGTCLNMKNKVMFAGTEFVSVPRKPKGHEYGPREIPKDIADDWVKNKFAEPLQHGERSSPNPMSVDDTRVAMPGLPPPPEASGESQVRLSEGGVAMTPVPPQAVTPMPPVVTAPSPWTFSRESLEGKLVEEMNAMIAERLDDVERPQFTPYLSSEEAVAHLTQDAAPTANASTF